MPRIALNLFFAALLLAGCSAFQPAPDTDADAAAINSIASLGDIGCAAAAIELKPDDLSTARESVTQARTILASPSPTMAALQLALEQGVPPRYHRVTAAALRSIGRSLGTTEILPPDSLALQMAAAFVEACSLGLGESDA